MNASTGDVNASTGIQEGFYRYTSVLCSVRNKAILARMNEASSAETIDDIDMGDGRAVDAGSSRMGLEG